MTGLDDWRDLLAAADDLDPDVVDRLISAHGSRGVQAIEAVSEGRVKQYNDFTVVVGHADEYIVEGESCTCKDAEYNLDADDPDQLCWHALAATIAREIDAMDEHDMYYADVHEFL